MNEQRKVATFSRGVSQKRKKILEALQHFPEGTTPKTLARETGINVNTIKSILPKLEGVQKVMRGFYKVEGGGDGGLPPPSELSDWNFHNLVLSADVSFPIGWAESFDFGLVHCEISVSKLGKAVCRVSSDFPLNVSSISFVAGWFAEKVNADFNKVLVKTIEFNRDFSNLRLDGARCLTVDSLIEQFKVYQKRRGLRVERKTKVNFSASDLVELLGQPPASVDNGVKLSRQSEVLDRLTRATNQNSQILLKIIDYLKGSDVE